MKASIIIPARFGSSRFPGKPLAKIKGISMLERVYKIACKCKNVSQVIIATDDQRIFAQAKDFGAQVVMTSLSCKNGTERVLEAAKTLDPIPDIVLNLQGDAVLTPPWVLDALLEAFSNPEINFATAATSISKQELSRLSSEKQAGNSTGTLVVCDLKSRALYFSKAMIPFLRDNSEIQPPVHRHIGIYAYRFKTLHDYVSLAETPLEKTEGLEQLRALENGIPVHVVKVDYKGRTHASVDKPEDIKLAEQLIESEGELF